MKLITYVFHLLIFTLTRIRGTPITRNCHIPLQNETYLTFKLTYDLNWYNPDYYISENLPNEFPSTLLLSENKGKEKKSIDDLIAEYESKLAEARNHIKEKYLDPQLVVLESEIDETHLEFVQRYKEIINKLYSATSSQNEFDLNQVRVVPYQDVLKLKTEKQNNKIEKIEKSTLVFKKPESKSVPKNNEQDKKGVTKPKTIDNMVDASFSANIETEKQTSVSYLENCQVEYIALLEENKSKAIKEFHIEVEKAVSNIKIVHDHLISRFRNCLMNRQKLLTKYDEGMNKKINYMVLSYQNKLKNYQAMRTQYIKSTFERLYSSDFNDKSYEGPIDYYNCNMDYEISNAVCDFSQKLKEKSENLKLQYELNMKCSFSSGIISYSQSTFEVSSPRKKYIDELYRRINYVKNFDYKWIGAEFSNLENCSSSENKFDNLNLNDHVLRIKEKSTILLNLLKDKVAGWKVKVEEWKDNMLKKADRKQHDISELSKVNTKEIKLPKLIPKKTDRKQPDISELSKVNTKEIELPNKKSGYQQYLSKRSKLWILEQEKQFYAEIDSREKEVCEKIETWKSIAINHVEKLQKELMNDENDLNKRVELYTNKMNIQRNEQKLFHKTQLLMLANEHKRNFDAFYSSAFGKSQFEEQIQILRTSYHRLVDTKVETAMCEFASYWDEVQPKLIENYKCKLYNNVKVTVPDLKLQYDWELKEPPVTVFMWR